MCALATSPDVDVAAAGECHRRLLLAESDALLEQIEELRLAERSDMPAALGESLRALQLRLGRVDATRPRTVRAAHQLVFALQQRLMAANPRHPGPHGHAGGSGGEAAIARLPRHWRLLVLPLQPPDPDAQAEWRGLVELTVERALDRWTCAQDQAVGRARARRSPVAHLRRAQAAWANYWQLRCEAEEVLGDVSRPAPDRLAARRPRQESSRPIESSRCSRW